MAARGSKAMTQPLTVIFRLLQSKTRIQVWLYEQAHMRIEGKIIGFDEFMNVVLDEAEEVNVKTRAKKAIGRILLKGDNITLIQTAPGPIGSFASAGASGGAGAGAVAAAGER